MKYFKKDFFVKQHDSMQCGLACLSMICRIFKELVSKLNVDNLPDSIKVSVINSIMRSMENISVPSFYLRNDKIGLYDSFGTKLGENYDFSIKQGQQNIINTCWLN